MKQTDLHGKYEYSVVRQVSFDNRNTVISVHPNPAKDYVVISGLRGEEIIKVYDASGCIVREMKLPQTSATIRLHSLSEGLYYIHIIHANGRTDFKKIVQVK